MNKYQEMQKAAFERLTTFLQENEVPVLERKNISYPIIMDNIVVIQPQTNLYSEYNLKYIVVTTESIMLKGIKTPYNYNQWITLSENFYSSKSELLDCINSFMYRAETVERIWN